MSIRRLILSAFAVIALAGWRLANPPVANAMPLGPCDVICGPPDCTDFEGVCGGCPGQWWCTDVGTPYCFGDPVDATYYCGGAS